MEVGCLSQIGLTRFRQMFMDFVYSVIEKVHQQAVWDLYVWEHEMMRSWKEVY